MRVLILWLNLVVASALLVAPAFAQERDPVVSGERVEELLERLARPDLQHWHRIERDLVNAWSQPGSATMDLLLKRGREALAAGETEAAIEHLTALTDHAPDFAEGWHIRATAFFQDGLIGPALADLERALALNPNHFGALTGLGTILEETGHPGRALRAYEAAHEIHPHHPRINAALARITRAVGGWDI